VSSPTFAPQPSGSGVKTALVAGGLVALLASNIALWYRVETSRTEEHTANQALLAEIAGLKEANSVTTASQRRNVDALKEELAAARAAANQAAGHAKQEAQAHADQLAKQLAAEQAQQQAKVQSQITDVQTQANAKIGEVSTDVSTVKTDLGSTKAQLDKTIANLQKVQGDLGVTSGYVATNQKELDALKRLNDRNYYQFTLLRKDKAPKRVGDISMKLKSADKKRNRYTIELVADDKTVEKKDKTVNEPLQFYVAKGGHQPYEIVVNTVDKDQITGYLATPKDAAPRN
jgi:multidrug efflux pump subunit AcrA (membrane-fusion protein)